MSSKLSETLKKTQQKTVTFTAVCQVIKLHETFCWQTGFLATAKPEGLNSETAMKN